MLQFANHLRAGCVSVDETLTKRSANLRFIFQICHFVTTPTIPPWTIPVATATVCTPSSCRIGCRFPRQTSFFVCATTGGNNAHTHIHVDLCLTLFLLVNHLAIPIVCIPVHRFSINSYTQELPSRFKKDVIRAVKQNENMIQVESLERVLQNIGASDKISRSELSVILSEQGNGSGHLSAQELSHILSQMVLMDRTIGRRLLMMDDGGMVMNKEHNEQSNTRGDNTGQGWQPMMQ